MRIALAGNPNSGKTTMYNALTGRSEKVGNWAGVTVDKKEHALKAAFLISTILSTGSLIIVSDKTILLISTSFSNVIVTLHDILFPFGNVAVTVGPVVSAIIFTPLIFLFTTFVAFCKLSYTVPV